MSLTLILSINSELILHPDAGKPMPSQFTNLAINHVLVLDHRQLIVG